MSKSYVKPSFVLAPQARQSQKARPGLIQSVSAISQGGFRQYITGDTSRSPGWFPTSTTRQDVVPPAESVEAAKASRNAVLLPAMGVRRKGAT